MIRDVAEGVGSAWRVLAGVDADLVLAGFVERTVLIDATFDAVAAFVGVSSEAWWAAALSTVASTVAFSTGRARVAEQAGIQALCVVAN